VQFGSATIRGHPPGCLEIPEIANISVNMPYAGTETWLMKPRKTQSRVYRLFDIQHAILPTKLPLSEFYQKLVKTQQGLNVTHLVWMALRSTATIAAGHLWREQMNFVKMLWKFRRDIGTSTEEFVETTRMGICQ